MSFYEREDKIINLLLQNNTITVDELSKKLFISKPTLRRDLIKLENKGIITRTHGGAKLIKNIASATIPFFLRETEQSSAKTTMAQKAASFVKDGDTIMLDGSTSAYSIIPYLSEFKNIIVITNSAKSSFLLGQMGIDNICTGGRMVNKSFSYIGGDAINTVSSYNADVLFFSCRGVSENGYLSDNSIEENLLRQTMIKHSKKKILLCAGKKFGNTYLHNLCHVSELDEIISESPIPENINKLLLS